MIEKDGRYYDKKIYSEPVKYQVGLRWSVIPEPQVVSHIVFKNEREALPNRRLRKKLGNKITDLDRRGKLNALIKGKKSQK